METLPDGEVVTRPELAFLNQLPPITFTSTCLPAAAYFKPRVSID